MSTVPDMTELDHRILKSDEGSSLFHSGPPSSILSSTVGDWKAFGCSLRTQPILDYRASSSSLLILLRFLYWESSPPWFLISADLYAHISLLKYARNYVPPDRRSSLLLIHFNKNRHWLLSSLIFAVLFFLPNRKVRYISLCATQN